jgi:hypothetical protein
VPVLRQDPGESGSATAGTPEAIGRAKLDCSEIDPSFITLPPSTETLGITVDAEYIYWANSAIESIGRADHRPGEPRRPRHRRAMHNRRRGGPITVVVR